MILASPFITLLPTRLLKNSWSKFHCTMDASTNKTVGPGRKAAQSTATPLNEKMMTGEFLKNWVQAFLTRSWVPMRFVAASYALGDGVKKNELRARKWYALAAKAGDLSSDFDLAMMLLYGEGGPVELERGKAVLEEAANRGEPQAQKVLAYAYQEPLFGYPVDYERAEYWKKLAEAQGMNV